MFMDRRIWAVALLFVAAVVAGGVAWTMAENLAGVEVPEGQDVVRPIGDPIAPQGGIAILRGSLAPEGAVVKIAGIELDVFEGLDLLVDDAELERRRAVWTAPPPRYPTGALDKYAKLVGSAGRGAVCG